ncbi:hypothetical protein AMATHDRAFT_85705 [Amanita thiersii Skay4041]|uniref:Uncharacterized protein n=1 Tax=Amanita thiersii Skay4041 TaxID=703135 RepID=A0A2A9NKI0_9AGAR|nr:hypothetical protein AMATHDRAFT_85705 [Amanita thiersii Skay4041]
MSLFVSFSLFSLSWLSKKLEAPDASLRKSLSAPALLGVLPDQSPQDSSSHFKSISEPSVPSSPVLVSACIVSPPILVDPVIVNQNPVPSPSQPQPGSSTLGAKITGLKQRVSTVEAENAKLKKEVADLKARLYQPGTGVSNVDDNGEQQDEGSRLKNEFEHLKNDYQFFKLKAKNTAEELIRCKTDYDVKRASNIKLMKQLEATRQEMYNKLVVEELKVAQFKCFVSAMIDIKLDESVSKRACRALQSGQSADAALVATIKEASKEGSPWATIIPAIVGDRPPELFLTVKRRADLEKRLSESDKKSERIIARMDTQNNNTDTPSFSSLYPVLVTCCVKEEPEVKIGDDILTLCDTSALIGSPRLQSEPTPNTPEQILFGSISKSVVLTPTDFGPSPVSPGNGSVSSVADAITTVRPYIPGCALRQSDGLTDLNEQHTANPVISGDDSLSSIVSGPAPSLTEDVESTLMSRGMSAFRRPASLTLKVKSLLE